LSEDLKELLGLTRLKNNYNYIFINLGKIDKKQTKKRSIYGIFFENLSDNDNIKINSTFGDGLHAKTYLDGNLYIKKEDNKSSNNHWNFFNRNRKNDNIEEKNKINYDKIFKNLGFDDKYNESFENKYTNNNISSEGGKRKSRRHLKKKSNKKTKKSRKSRRHRKYK
jgi:hypothetical protein